MGTIRSVFLRLYVVAIAPFLWIERLVVGDEEPGLGHSDQSDH